MQVHYAFVTRGAGDGFAEVTELNDTVAIEKALYERQFVRPDGYAQWPQAFTHWLGRGASSRSRTEAIAS